ncbi:MAG: hypothetical protein HGB11_13600, partial [Chlorobiales bacterium]|nr:hypothetical protein [Chlorobiales bacterium]
MANTALKTRFWKTGRWFTGLFVLLFLFRLLYGYVETDTTVNNDYSENFFSSIDNLRKNYASEKIVMKGSNVQLAASIASSQKYEKTASLKIKTSEFESDEKLVKEKSKAFNAVIQYEQNLGQKGNRQIHLLIGVNPALFDSLYGELKKIGVLKVGKSNISEDYLINYKVSIYEDIMDMLDALELIRRSGVKRIGIQAPEGLKRALPEIAKEISENTG